MSKADLVAVIAFLVLVFLGLLVMAAQHLLQQRPEGRVRSRLKNLVQEERNPAHQRAVEDMSRAERETRHRQRRQAMGWAGNYLSRAETISGRRGLYVLIGTTVILLLATIFVVWPFMPLPWWAKIILTVALPCVGAAVVYGRLNEKFRTAFLTQLPDILDMIIRASQAGVPVTQSLRNVGDSFDWPAGPEFRRIGDSLKLGNDMAVVLDEAEERIRLPDFSFLSVCLLLQRETGGSLSATLTNLASVIRGRRDLRLKARALTAEGRLTGIVMSAIPLVIMLAMWFVSPDYIAVLFNTEAGNKILMTAAIMLSIGVLVIRKIAKLEV